MMPFIRTSQLCRQSQRIAEQCKLELDRLRDRQFKAEDYIASAREFLKTAAWPGEALQQAGGEVSDANQAGPLPILRGADAGWNERAQETRVLAEKIKDAATRREMLEIADCYDGLGAGTAPNPAPATRAPSKLDAIAA
jgi:hypothetical protein